ncbi:MAG TPA: hypothetical protein VER03_00755 [Bryobacteraceae bacterium]|nr:hypothetical protein [Bryobacteraceae bacterium]
MAHLKCGDKLGQLGNVTPEIVGAIAGETVKVVPVCQYSSLVGEQSPDLLHAVGNAGGLHPSIGANPVLDGALDGRGYNEDHVVGLALGDNTVVLYVHKS